MIKQSPVSLIWQLCFQINGLINPFVHCQRKSKVSYRQSKNHQFLLFDKGFKECLIIKIIVGGKKLTWISHFYCMPLLFLTFPRLISVLHWNCATPLLQSASQYAKRLHRWVTCIITAGFFAFPAVRGEESWFWRKEKFSQWSLEAQMGEKVFETGIPSECLHKSQIIFAGGVMLCFSPVFKGRKGNRKLCCIKLLLSERHGGLGGGLGSRYLDATAV